MFAPRPIVAAAAVAAAASFGAAAPIETVPAVEAGPAVPAAPAPSAPSAPALYNCDLEADVWVTAWTPDWKAWCCENDKSGRGCPFTTTVTSTSTATSTVTTTTTTTTLDPNIEDYACTLKCEHGGQTHTCNERMQWASDFLFAGMVDPCDAAHILVQSQCEPCKYCRLHKSSCKNKETAEESTVIDDAKDASPNAAASEANTMEFRRKFEDRPLRTESAGAGVADRLSQFSILSLFGFLSMASACVVLARRRAGRTHFAKRCIGPVDGPIDGDFVDVLAGDLEARAADAQE